MDCGLDDFVVSQGTGANVGTDLFHGGMLDSMSHGQYVDREHQSDAVQQAGCAFLQGAGPEYADVNRGILSSQHDVPTPSQAQSDTIRRLDTANIGALSHSTTPSCSLPVQLTGHVPKKASKRKRIKTALSRKKTCLTTPQQIYHEDSSALKNDFSSKLTLRAEGANATATNDIMSSKERSRDWVTGYRRLNCTPAWEQDSAGIAKDIRIPESERRPMSWPHRNPWRKSLDNSVAVLAKGFEKLMTERGEASPSAT